MNEGFVSLLTYTHMLYPNPLAVNKLCWWSCYDPLVSRLCYTNPKLSVMRRWHMHICAFGYIHCSWIKL